jgi:hypothetical protein
MAPKKKLGEKKHGVLLADRIFQVSDFATYQEFVEKRLRFMDSV